MLQTHQVEELICLVSVLDRGSLVRQFRSYRSNFPVDFSDAFLEATEVDRLRHIFIALCLQHQRLPDPCEAPATAA
ncbi:MAG: hypothetical protein ACREIT_10300 [Tepidisphaeraceae bacterium]